MATGYKRRNIFIKKDFQGKIILSTFLLVTGGGLLFMVMFTIFSADSLTISYTNHNLQFGQTPLMLIKQALTANWILISIGGTVLVIASMIFSHRIAGPLFRFEKTLDNMISGRLDDKIYLRGRDEGKELAAKINQFNADLSKSIRTINHNTIALETLIEQATALNLPEGDRETLASLYWSMQEHNRKIKNTCSAYTLKDE
jgi:methyl-accepting chemotaxis protein